MRYCAVPLCVLVKLALEYVDPAFPNAATFDPAESSACTTRKLGSASWLSVIVGAVPV